MDEKTISVPMEADENGLFGFSPTLSEPACFTLVPLSHAACQLALFAPFSEQGRAAPSRLVFSGGFSWAQPQRDMRRLHRLLQHGQQFLPQLIQVHFLPQGGAEGSQRLGRIIFATVEAPINHILDASA